MCARYPDESPNAPSTITGELAPSGSFAMHVFLSVLAAEMVGLERR